MNKVAEAMMAKKEVNRRGRTVVKKPAPKKKAPKKRHTGRTMYA